jgi:TRAP-type C4-dicarboxylate transport system substrate-binding protein
MTEIYMALQQGVVEGRTMGLPCHAAQIPEAAKYWCATDHVYEVTSGSIEKAWTKLNAEKKIFLEAPGKRGR